SVPKPATPAYCASYSPTAKTPRTSRSKRSPGKNSSTRSTTSALHCSTASTPPKAARARSASSRFVERTPTMDTRSFERTRGFGLRCSWVALLALAAAGAAAQDEEELNRIAGGHYGWPYVYSDGRFNPRDEPPAGLSMEEWAEQSIEPL